MSIDFSHTERVNGIVMTSIDSSLDRYGSGLISPVPVSQFYLSIPKNASSFVESWASKSGWTSAIAYTRGCDWHLVEEIVVVVRDPMERWISGVTQFIKSYILGDGCAQTFVSQYNEYVERLIFSNVNNLDDHVWSQSYFIDGVYPEIPRKFIMMNENFEFNIHRMMNLTEFQPDGIDYNSSVMDRDGKILHQFFENLLQERGDLCEIVELAYKKDFDMLEMNDIIT